MSVTRVHEDPRVTKPFNDAQWKAIDALGEQVDRDLARARRAPDAGRRADVRVDRRHGRAGVELHRAVAEEARAGRAAAAGACKARFAPGRLRCTSARASGIRASRCRAGRSASSGASTGSRCGGIPRWSPIRPGPARSTGARRATFGETLVTALGLPASLLITAYEDVPKLLAAEAALPVNVDPLQADLARPDERARLARLLAGGLGAPAGYVLPLRASGRRRRTRGLAVEPVAAAPRASVPRRRRFAARAAAAAGVAAGRAAGGAGAGVRGRSLRAARHAAAARRP